MLKQKICVIGGGLTGLVTAITLSRLNFNIDLVINKSYELIKKSNRTSAISQNNYDFLNKLNIFNLEKNFFWPCSRMKLYGKNRNEKFIEIFDVYKNKNTTKQILYMIDNLVLMKQMIKKIKKNKSINFIVKKNLYKIKNSNFLKSIKTKKNKNSKYNLIIVCTGNNSSLAKTISSNEYYHHSYGEVSITTVIKHEVVKNNIARQIFFDDDIIAFLPISNNKTSVVWTTKKRLVYQYKNKGESFFKKKIESYSQNFYKKVKFISNIELKNLNLFIQKKYYQDRILLFGDALHEVHPFAGQGFNMTLRDLKILEKKLKIKLNLGLDIGSSDVLSEFSNEIKPRNFIYSMGIDFIKNCFSSQRISFNFLRNKIISRLNKNNFAKDIFIDLADKGFNF